MAARADAEGMIRTERSANAAAAKKAEVGYDGSVSDDASYEDSLDNENSAGGAAGAEEEQGADVVNSDPREQQALEDAVDPDVSEASAGAHLVSG